MELAICDQVAFPWASKKWCSSTVCHAWKCFLTAVSGGLGIPDDPGCHMLWVFREGLKNYFEDKCLMNSQSTFFCFYLILSLN